MQKLSGLKLFKYWPLAGVVLIWLLFCAPYIKGQIPFPSKYLVTFFPPWNTDYAMPVKNAAMPDVITQILPWKKLTIDTYKSGQIPLWNPYAFSGTVHAANYQTAVFSPVNLLFFWLPFIDAWSIMILLQPLLAGIFMYLYLSSHKLGKVPVTIGSMSFMFCGFITCWMAYGTLGYAALYLPLIFLLIDGYFLNSHPTAGVAISLTTALSFLSGHFQISLYVFAACIFYIFFRSMIERKFKSAPAAFFYLIAGTFLSAPQILLTLEAYYNSVRSSLFVPGEIIPWSYLITAWAPDFFGNPVTRNDWFGHYAEWSVYSGVVPLFLAGLAAIKFKRTPEIRFFISLLLFSLFLSHKGIFADILFLLKIPVLGTSAAGRIILLSSFAISVLAAYGADLVGRLQKGEFSKEIARFTVTVSIILAGLAGSIFIFKPLPADKMVIAMRNSVLSAGMTVFFLLSLIFILKFNNRTIKNTILVIFLILTGFDMWRYASKFMPFEPREYVYPQNQTIKFLSQKAGTDRVFGNIGGEVGNYFRLHLIDGYDAMYKDNYGKFLNSAHDGTIIPSGRSVVNLDKYGIYKDRIVNLLSVRYILHRKSDGRSPWAYPVWDYPSEKLRKIHEDKNYELYENHSALPRYFMTADIKVIPDDKQVLKNIFSPGFDYRKRIILPESPPVKTQTGNAIISLKKYTPNEIIYSVKSDTNQMLYESEIYDPGWKAYIDNRKTPVYRANYIFRSVGFPAGSHEIILKYQPDSFRYGSAITAISGLTLLVLLVFKRQAKSVIHKKLR